MADQINQLPNNEATNPVALTDVVPMDRDPSGTPVTEQRTWDQIRSLLDSRTINTQTGTSYTLVASDRFEPVVMDNASANTVTVPDAVFSAGNRVLIVQAGAGSTTIAAGSGFTLNNPTSVDLEIGEQHGARVLLFTSASEATVI